MDRIREAFRRHFEGQGIDLPHPLPRDGSLDHDGWSIRYVLSQDAEGRPELELLVQHRLLDAPEHLRIAHDGTMVALDSYETSYSFDPATDPDGSAARQRMQEHNQRVEEELRRKGLA